MKELIGKSWGDVGRCWGLARAVNSRLGLNLPAWEDIDPLKAAEEIARRRPFFMRVTGEPAPGDVVHLRGPAGRAPHVAVCIGGGLVLNVDERLGVHRLRLDHPFIKTRIEGVYRFDPAHGDTMLPVDAAPQSKEVGAAIGLIALSAVAVWMVAPAVTAGLTALGTSAAAAGTWGSMAGMATITAGGIALNSLLAGGDDETYKSITYRSDPEASPTYGWQAGANTAREGLSIPVVYGQAFLTPQVLNQWIEVDGDDEWYHTLLCLAEGVSDQVITGEDIYLDKQPITVLPDGDYNFGYTTGGANPAAALANFEYLHQMRPINKELATAVLSQFLLHFNGTNGSTDIVDDGVGIAWQDQTDIIEADMTNNWTAYSTAALSTANPFLGSAALDLETSGDYIGCDNWYAFNIWTENEWDFECRFRQDALTNSAICGQVLTEADGDTHAWGIFYDHTNTNLVFQQWKKTISSVYTVYFNVSISATLTVDTWHHVRLCRQGNTIYVYLDGSRLGSGAKTTAPVEPVPLTDAQYVGRAQWYTGSGDSTWYGCCELDEVRLTAYSLIYGTGASFDEPTNQIADDGEQTWTTQGEIDRFSVKITAPYGMYYQSADGTLETTAALTFISYRKLGTTVWYRRSLMCGVDDAKRTPRRWQLEITPEGERGVYEIRVARVSDEYEQTISNQYMTRIHLAHIDEILEESLRYPYLQVVGVSIRAQEKISGRMPVITIRAERSTIDVPALGYGLDAGNNAIIAADVFTNRVYGPGLDKARVSEARLDWLAWRDWCDGTVGGETRCRFNMVFDSGYTLDAALAQVEACGRARVFPRGAKLVPVIDQPVSAAALFNPTNILPGSDRITWVRKSQRVDATEITYFDADLLGVERSVLHKGEGYDELERDPRVNRIEIRGINSAAQATREAILRQQISDATDRLLEFGSGLEGFPLTAGDVVDFASGGSSLIFSGRLARGVARVEQYTGTTVYIDEAITLPAATFSGDCQLVVRNTDDTLSVYTVSGPFDTKTRNITVSASGTFNFLSPWMITRASGEIYQYRLRRITRSAELAVAVSAAQYEASAYYHSDYDAGATAL